MSKVLVGSASVAEEGVAVVLEDGGKVSDAELSAAGAGVGTKGGAEALRAKSDEAVLLCEDCSRDTTSWSGSDVGASALRANGMNVVAVGLRAEADTEDLLQGGLMTEDELSASSCTCIAGTNVAAVAFRTDSQEGLQSTVSMELDPRGTNGGAEKLRAGLGIT